MAAIVLRFNPSRPRASRRGIAIHAGDPLFGIVESLRRLHAVEPREIQSFVYQVEWLIDKYQRGYRRDW